jgi:hypothetical protein
LNGQARRLFFELLKTAKRATAHDELDGFRTSGHEEFIGSFADFNKT